MIDLSANSLANHPVILKLKSKNLFNTYNEQNVKWFYVLTFFYFANFTMGSWIAYLLHYITGTQLGLIDVISLIAATLFEIPTGAIADLLGRKITIVLATLFAGIGVYATAFTFNFTGILIGSILFLAVAGSLFSGAGEALLYDSLVEAKKEHVFDSVIANTNIIKLIGMILTSITGSIIYSQNLTYPWIAWIIFYAFSFIAALNLKEPAYEKVAFSFSNYFKQFYEGSKQVFDKKLFIYLPAIGISSGLLYSFDPGILWTGFAYATGFSDVTHGYEYAAITLITALVIFKFPTIRKSITDFDGMKIIVLVLGLAFTLLYFNLNINLSFLLLLLISVGGNLSLSWTSVIVNAKIKSEYRATALSVIALIIKIPYLVIALFAGALIDQNRILDLSLTLGIITLTIFVVLLLLSFRTSFFRS